MAQELRGSWRHQNKVAPSLEGLTWGGVGGDPKEAPEEGLAESQLREASAELGGGSESETLLG